MADPVLTTAHYTLTPLDADDRDEFVAYRQIPDVAQFQGWTPEYSTADADLLIKRQPTSFPPPRGEWLQLAIHDTDGALVGDVGLHALAAPDQPDTYEVGITLAPAAQKRGVAAEVMSALVRALFMTHGAHRIVGNSDARNERVAALFKRVGFRHEGRALSSEHAKGEWIDIDSWAMLRYDVDGKGRPIPQPTMPLLHYW